MVIVLNDYHVYSWYHVRWGSRYLLTGDTWSSHGLPWVLLPGLWLSFMRYCLCVFDAIIELHIMDEKMFNDFLIGRWKWIVYVIRVYLIHDLAFWICSEFIKLNWKARYKYMSPFSMPLVHMHLFFSFLINFAYIWSLISMDPRMSFSFSMKSPPPGNLFDFLVAHWQRTSIIHNNLRSTPELDGNINGSFKYICIHT